jgi:hypothetical protein
MLSLMGLVEIRQGSGAYVLRRPQAMVAASVSLMLVELFFDLVYVFAVTRLSHYLLDHRSFAGRCRPPCSSRWSGWPGPTPPSTTGYTAGSDQGCVDG